jgi:PIN domain nuclease of toxin-antitoxin system
MAALIYLDTHVVAWAFQGEIERIPTAAQDAIDINDPLISPIVLVEVSTRFLAESISLLLSLESSR